MATGMERYRQVRLSVTEGLFCRVCNSIHESIWAEEPGFEGVTIEVKPGEYGAVVYMTFPDDTVLPIASAQERDGVVGGVAYFVHPMAFNEMLFITGEISMPMSDKWSALLSELSDTACRYIAASGFIADRDS